MKRLIILSILTLSLSGYSQTKPNTFAYSWSINHGVFTAVYLNTPWGVGTSSDATGTFSLMCKEHYLELIVKLWNYGQTTAHIPTRGFNGIDDNGIPGLHVILQTSHPFILIMDSQGRVWKLTKPNAVALAEILMQQNLIDQIPACTQCPCNGH
ncbi:hypothetical protein [Flavobacterium sp.]